MNGDKVAIMVGLAIAALGAMMILIVGITALVLYADFKDLLIVGGIAGVVMLIVGLFIGLPE